MDTPVILLTARQEIDAKVEGLNMGANDYLAKPFSPREMLARIEAQLRLRDAAVRAAENERLAATGLLTSGFAHEVRNPLNGLMNSLLPLRESLTATTPDIGMAVAMLELIEECGGRIRHLAEGLLSFVRTGNKAQAVDLGASLDASVQALSWRLPPDMKVERDYRCAEPVWSDPGSLNQVWVNLLDNAVRALGTTQGRVKVSTATVTARRRWSPSRTPAWASSPSTWSGSSSPSSPRATRARARAWGSRSASASSSSRAGASASSASYGKGTRVEVRLPLEADPDRILPPLLVRWPGASAALAHVGRLAATGRVGCRGRASDSKWAAFRLSLPTCQDFPRMQQSTATAPAKGHPKGLYLLFTTEMWERMSYYGMRALLVLYMVSASTKGGFGWSQGKALEIYGIYTGLVYLTPVAGGFLADRFLGQRLSVTLGGILMMLGQFVLAIPGNTEALFFGGLGLLVVGNGFFKPNISTMVGGLYEPGDPRRDGAFTIFYIGINVGAFLASAICGTLGEKYGWGWGFGSAGVGMGLGVIVFLAFGNKLLGNLGKEPQGRRKEGSAQQPQVALTREETDRVHGDPHPGTRGGLLLGGVRAGRRPDEPLHGLQGEPERVRLRGAHHVVPGRQPHLHHAAGPRLRRGVAERWAASARTRPSPRRWPWACCCSPSASCSCWARASRARRRARRR